VLTLTVFRSDREVHEACALLPNLQLCEQDHPGAAVTLHVLPVRSAPRGLEGPRQAHRRPRKVRLIDRWCACNAFSRVLLVACAGQAQHDGGWL
jgi:hypothetical protein